MIFEIFKWIIFKVIYNNFSIAQLVEGQTGVLEVPGSNSSLGDFFSLPFNEEMNPMVKNNKKNNSNNNNNSRNSLVFDRWPQTKTDA